MERPGKVREPEHAGSAGEREDGAGERCAGRRIRVVARPRTLVALALTGAVCVAVSAASTGSASAVASRQIPVALQRLLVQAARLRPTSFTVAVAGSPRTGQPYRDTLTIGQAPQREDLALSEKQGLTELRVVGGHEYDAAPGLGSITGGARWVSQSAGSATGAAPAATVGYAELVVGGLRHELAVASRVTEVDAVRARGLTTTVFAITLRVTAGIEHVRVGIAPDGEVIRESGTSGAGDYVAIVSTTGSARVVAPRAAQTTALSSLPSRQRARAAAAIQSGHLAAGLPISIALGLL